MENGERNQWNGIAVDLSTSAERLTKENGERNSRGF